jgi:hypothetical protein
MKDKVTTAIAQVSALAQRLAGLDTAEEVADAVVRSMPWSDIRVLGEDAVRGIALSVVPIARLISQKENDDENEDE